MSKCCNAPVDIDKEGIWCMACNKLCEIDYDKEYVIKYREGRVTLHHFKCDIVTTEKKDILNKYCTHCGEYLK